MANEYVNVFNNIESAAATSIKVVEGDYQLDGLWYCGKCNTKKQTRVNFFGTERTPMCLCECAAQKLKDEEEERKRGEFMLRIEKLRKNGFSEEKMRGWTFATDDRANERVSDVALKYVENFDVMKQKGKGLLLFGSTGTGKTFAAACIANALIDKGVPCLMTNFARIANTLQGMFEGKQEYLDRLNRVPLLVLDDLGIERRSEYMHEIVYNVIDARCRSGLPLIVTTNLTGAELKNADDIVNQRIYSRLFECCIPLEVKGDDRRRKKLKEDFSEFNDLLGL